MLFKNFREEIPPEQRLTDITENEVGGGRNNAGIWWNSWNCRHIPWGLSDFRSIICIDIHEKHRKFYPEKLQRLTAKDHWNVWGFLTCSHWHSTWTSCNSGCKIKRKFKKKKVRWEAVIFLILKSKLLTDSINLQRTLHKTQVHRLHEVRWGWSRFYITGVDNIECYCNETVPKATSKTENARYTNLWHFSNK